MSVTGVVGWQNIRKLDVGIALPDEVYAGTATMATVRVRNAKRRFPSFLLQATFLENSCMVRLLGGNREETNSFVHTFPERGKYSIPPGEIRSPFPVNFFVRYRRYPLCSEILVFPKPKQCSAGSIDGRASRKGISPLAVKGIDGDFLRIADYTGNEPMKLIHWRLSAKFEDLKVRELNASAGEPVTIDLDSLPGRDLEEKLSQACFLINRLMGLNRPVGLKLGERVIRPAASREHRLDLLTELALHGKN